MRLLLIHTNSVLQGTYRQLTCFFFRGAGKKASTYQKKKIKEEGGSGGGGGGEKKIGAEIGPARACYEQQECQIWRWRSKRSTKRRQLVHNRRCCWCCVVFPQVQKHLPTYTLVSVPLKYSHVHINMRASAHTHTHRVCKKKGQEGLLFSPPLRSTSEYSVTNTEGTKGDGVTAQMKNKFLLSPSVSSPRYYHTDRSLTFLPCHSGS